MSLRGIKVLEIGGLAPVPYCGMILSDHGANVIRVDRSGSAHFDVLSRGKKSIALDLKHPLGQAAFVRLASTADVVIDPFRPKVMERLGLGPSVLCQVNPRLIYARLSGFGQEGPMSLAAGHDVNYLALSGALAYGDPPGIASNVLGDFGGGGLMCALGIVMAIHERSTSGRGQVVDAAICDGAAYLNAFGVHSKDVLYSDKSGRNLLDGGAHFYGVYKCADDQWMAVGAIEPPFYDAFVKTLGLDVGQDHVQFDKSAWPALKKQVAALFRTAPRATWESRFAGIDACVTPVLSLHEMGENAHVRARNLIMENGEVLPAPRMSRTPAHTDARPRPQHGAHTIEVLREAGWTPEEMDELVEHGVVGIGDAGIGSAKL